MISCVEQGMLNRCGPGRQGDLVVRLDQIETDTRDRQRARSSGQAGRARGDGREHCATGVEALALSPTIT